MGTSSISCKIKIFVIKQKSENRVCEVKSASI